MEAANNEEKVQEGVYQTSPEVLHPVDIEKRLIWCHENLGNMRMRLLVELPTEQSDKLRQIQKDQEEVIDDSSESDVSDEDIYNKEYREQMEVGEKQIHVLQLDYADEMKTLAQQTGVQLVLTASKMKLFADRERSLDDALRLLSALTQRICVQIIEKYGKILKESQIYSKKIAPVRMFQWKKQYYFYFDKQKIKINEARILIEEAMAVEHYGVFLLRMHLFDREHIMFVRMMYAHYAKEHLLRVDNQAEREQLKSEISKDGRAIILHSKSGGFLQEKALHYEAQLRDNTVLFMLKLKPGLTEAEVAVLNEGIRPAKKYVVFEMSAVTTYTLAGIMLSKTNLLSILSKQKHRELFSRIFPKAISINSGGMVELLVFLPEPSQKKKRYIDNKLQAAWNVNWPSRQILQCVPKMLDSDTKTSDFYMKALSDICSYKEPKQDEMTKLNITNMNESSLNNTSIIQESLLNNTSMLLDTSALNTSTNSTTNADVKQTYNVCLNLSPTYGSLGEHEVYKRGEKNKELCSKLEQLTNNEYQVRAVILNERYRDIPHEQPPGQIVTLAMGKNALFGKECHLFKLRPGMDLQQGFLVEASVAGLPVQKWGFYVAPNASIFRPTHIIEKL